MSKDIGFGKYIINVSNLSEWLSKYMIPNSNSQYLTSKDMKSFINQNENMGVDELTRLNLEIKIYEHFRVTLGEDGEKAYQERLDVVKNNKDLTYLERNSKIKKIYESKIKAYKTAVSGNSIEEEINHEIDKLPNKYKNEDESMLNNNSINKKPTYQTRQAQAKQKIELYRTKQISKNAMIQATNKAIMVYKKGGRA